MNQQQPRLHLVGVLDAIDPDRDLFLRSRIHDFVSAPFNLYPMVRRDQVFSSFSSTPPSGNAEGQQPSMPLAKPLVCPTKEKSDFFANRHGPPIGAAKLNKITINRRLTIFAKIHGFVQNSLCQTLAINSSSPQKLPY